MYPPSGFRWISSHRKREYPIDRRPQVKPSSPKHPEHLSAGELADRSGCGLAIDAGPAGDIGRQGLTLADVSDRSGLDIGLLSRLENGKVANPTLTTLWRYANALGRTVTLDVGESATSG